MDLIAILLVTPLSDRFHHHRALFFSVPVLIQIAGLLVTTYAGSQHHPWPRYGGLLLVGFGKMSPRVSASRISDLTSRVGSHCAYLYDLDHRNLPTASRRGGGCRGFGSGLRPRQPRIHPDDLRPLRRMGHGCQTRSSAVSEEQSCDGGDPVWLHPQLRYHDYLIESIWSRTRTQASQQRKFHKRGRRRDCRRRRTEGSAREGTWPDLVEAEMSSRDGSCQTPGQGSLRQWTA